MLKKVIYSILLGIVLGLSALLVINYLKYDNLVKENAIITKDNSVIKQENDSLDEYLTELNKSYQTLQEEKKNLIEEYKLWQKRNQEIKSYL